MFILPIAFFNSCLYILNVGNDADNIKKASQMNTSARKIEKASNGLASVFKSKPTDSQIMAQVKVPDPYYIVEGPRKDARGKMVKVTGTIHCTWKEGVEPETLPTLAMARLALEALKCQNAKALKCWEILYKDSSYVALRGVVYREYYSTLESKSDTLREMTIRDAHKSLSRA